MPSTTSSRDEIRELVERMNDAWVTGHPEQLGSFFREDIVIVSPGFSDRMEGRDAAVRSYAEFCSQAVVNEFTIGETGIDVFGDTAVATYGYQISYEMGGERFTDSGSDLFVFVRENNQWQAAWRTMIIAQSEKVN
jgi:uncharacterized protein (TIGR02246 family)